MKKNQKTTSSKLYNKCKNSGKSNANSLNFCKVLVNALCLEKKNLPLWVFQNILFLRYSFEKILENLCSLSLNIVVWEMASWSFLHFFLTDSGLCCQVVWIFPPFFINIFSWSQICAVSFPAVNVRHEVSTGKVASTSIYEELNLVTLKHGYWFLFLFNKTYFHKRWKGDGGKFSAMERIALDCTPVLILRWINEAKYALYCIFRYIWSRNCNVIQHFLKLSVEMWH